MKGNEVQVGGIAVGEITDIELSEDNQADIKITVNERFAPLHEGTKAIVRVASLPSRREPLHLAHPGPNNAPRSPRAAVLETDETTNAVDLDQLFNTLDPKTRKGLQRRAPGIRRLVRRPGREPATRPSSTSARRSQLHSQVMQELGRDQKTFTDLVVNGARATSAIASRRDDLAALVSNGERLRAGDRRRERVARPRAGGLPGRLAEGSTTFVQPARRARSS